jgi:hypothetical protein
MKKIALVFLTLLALTPILAAPALAAGPYLSIDVPAQAVGWYKIVWDSTHTSDNLQPITGATVTSCTPGKDCLLIFDVSTLAPGTNYSSANIYACQASATLTPSGGTTETGGETCSPPLPFSLVMGQALPAVTGVKLSQ